jgi:hypothetical protein
MTGYWTDICHLWVLVALQKCCTSTVAGHRCFPLIIGKWDTCQRNHQCLFTYSLVLVAVPQLVYAWWIDAWRVCVCVDSWYHLELWVLRVYFSVVMVLFWNMENNMENGMANEVALTFLRYIRPVKRIACRALWCVCVKFYCYYYCTICPRDLQN